MYPLQATGLLQALEDIKAVLLEPRGQGKIEGVLSDYYVSSPYLFSVLSSFNTMVLVCILRSSNTSQVTIVHTSTVSD